MATLPRMNIAIVLCVVMACAQTLAAQPRPVTGTVIDARTGLPLAGVLISVDDQWTTTTDASGRFSLGIPVGSHVLKASTIGFAIGQQAIDVRENSVEALTIRLEEGTGGVAEHVTVTGAAVDDAGSAPGGASLHSRELLSLRGVMLDDPLRAVQALPSATATDDFYSEFAVRGSGFRHIGLTVDGIPSRYLMHTVHGVTDGGSIAMVNSETLDSVTLLPGSYAQRTGRRIGAQVDLMTRNGSRQEFRGRAGLSGTSATFVAEGPLAGSRGSWLASGRRSYLDLLIKQIDSDADFAFGFSDAQTKLVYDLGPRHQLQFLTILGRSDFDEELADLGANDEARATATAWLSSLSWRYTPADRTIVSQRVYFTGVDFSNRNRSGESLDQGRFTDLAWRTDVSYAASAAVLVDAGAEVQHLSGIRTQARVFDGQTHAAQLSEFDERDGALGLYIQTTAKLGRSIRVVPGVRVDRWGLTNESAISPWLTASWAVGPATDLHFGTGRYRQFADFDQVYGVRRGGEDLRAERAAHIDVGIVQRIGGAMKVQVTGYSRNETDILWTPEGEPRRLADGTIQPGRGDGRWANRLNGRARGVEFLLRRDAPSGLSGWIGYAFGHHRYRDHVTNETFWADADQRHTLSLYGSYRLSNRATIASKFRYGSNYPMIGYIGRQPSAPHAPPLFGDLQPLFFGLSDERNTLRLPAYARLDVRAERAFTWRDRRLTAFIEVANALNRTNVRNVPYGVDRSGRVTGATDTLMPMVPSGGFVVEF